MSIKQWASARLGGVKLTPEKIKQLDAAMKADHMRHREDRMKALATEAEVQFDKLARVYKATRDKPDSDKLNAASEVARRSAEKARALAEELSMVDRENKAKWQELERKMFRLAHWRQNDLRARLGE